MSPKARSIGYIAATALFCLAMTAGGFGNLLKAQPQAEAMAALGYPLYLMPFLGVAKLLGVLALAVPGRGRLKEWAFAGFTFDLLGASYSHASSQDPAPAILIPLVILGIGSLSYYWRPASRRI